MNYFKNIGFEDELSELIYNNSIHSTYQVGDLITSDEPYINHIGFIYNGISKVCYENHKSSLLLYHLCSENDPIINMMEIGNIISSRINIFCLKESKLFWVSYENILEWEKLFFSLKTAINNSNESNIQNLIVMIRNLNFKSIKTRIYDYLLTRSIVCKRRDLEITFNEISYDLNVSSAAVSRNIKKLESEKKIIRKLNSILLVSDMS